MNKVVTKLSLTKNYCTREYHQKFMEKRRWFMSLVSTDWLYNNINKVKIFDSSWHLPNENRNAFEEYKGHIQGSIF